ncbi:MAG: sigma-54-dependent transcriptional regulator [Steroidobacteraceae bacterium]
MSKPSILVADDHADVRQALSLLLRDCGYEVLTAASPSEALSALRQSPPDLILLDLNYQRDTTSGAEGLELLKQIRARHRELPVVILTGWATVSLAVEAMHLGAQDFLEKPWENTRVRSLVAQHLAAARARAEVHRLEDEGQPSDGEADAPLHHSRAMQEVLAVAGRVASSDVSVLLTGESGTGKSLVARWIHRHSPRARGPFVSLNLGGLAETLFESELFGHVKGAFTDARSDRVGRIERARGGTLFLDEISNITPAQQARLLHVLEDGTFERVGETVPRPADARILAATNADIRQLIRDGGFREDLYFRLNTVEIVLPPLRARRDDIPLLATYFLARCTKASARGPITLTEGASRALDAYDWPGNVRELAHVMERAVLLAKGEAIEVADLKLTERDATETLENLTLEQAERYVIQRALESCGGDVTVAAAKLGMSRSALYRRLEKIRE